jgi:glycosyltransferase involved in cell wall biosynthesis
MAKAERESYCDACIASSGLRIVQIGSFGDIGDSVYRMHEPAAALACLSGIEMYEVHPQARHRDAAALAADVVVLTMTLDVEVFRLIHQRRLAGRVTICEINDYIPDVQPWNPAHRTWSDSRARYIAEELMRRCDGVQVTTPSLAEWVAPMARQVSVLPNHLVEIPPLRHRNAAPPSPRRPLVIGWGGSVGHLQDLESTVPVLLKWFQEHPEVQLQVMGDELIADLFTELPSQQFSFRPGGSLDNYLKWLEQIDIGIAPLLDTQYNRCRSDVKFLEYASRGVVPVLQRLNPYQQVDDGDTAFLFGNPAELISILNRLISSGQLRQQTAIAAYTHVNRERRLQNHVSQRLAFYNELIAASAPASANLEPPLRTAIDQDMHAIPGWQQRGPHHWRLHLHTAADRQRAAGVEAMQEGALDQAMACFQNAFDLDPSDAFSLTFLGYGLQQRGHLSQAQAAYEQAMAIDPQLSRPVRALARLHQKAAAHYARRADELNPRTPTTWAAD